MADLSQYFALLPTKEIGSALIEKKDQYYRYLMETGRSELLRKVYFHLNKSAFKRGSLSRYGVQGEYVGMNANHLRNLADHRLSLTVNQRPYYEPKAANTDYRSQAQVTLARGLLEYYNRVMKMERHVTKAVENAIAYAEGFVYQGWSPTGGEQYGTHPQTGAPIYEGDVELDSLSTFDVIRDPGRRTNDKPRWLMIRRLKNKHDLAAKYPELAERLRALSVPPHTQYITRFIADEEIYCEDEIETWTFFHARTEALPNGRIVEFADGDAVLHDGPLPYKNIPVYRIAAREMDDRLYGYTNTFDCLNLQTAVDKLYSTVLTNQAAFGVQNIALPKGSGVSITKLSGGINVVEYDPKAGAPAPLQLTSTPAEVFDFIKQIETLMETLMGVNSVSRGNPESSLKSGSALALVQSMAIQFAQTLQQNYNLLLEDVGTGLVQLLQEYAAVPRVAMIAGKSNRSYMREFKSDDLDSITRVLVDMGNPLSQTVAGRINLADMMLQSGQITSPQNYLEVLTSGRFEPLVEGQQAELLLIRDENEKLQEGNEPMAIRLDDHMLHIQEHKAVLATVTGREDPLVVQATLNHIAQHEMLAMPPMPLTPEGMPVEQIDNGAAPTGAAEQLDVTNPTMQEAQSVNMPSMPTVAGTQQQFNPSEGM